VRKLQGAFPTTLLCRLLDLARSSYYYPAHPRDDSTLQAQLRTVSGTYPTYGILRLTEQVRRDYQTVNPKRVRRVAREMGIQPKNKRKKRYTTQSQHAFPRYPNLVLGLPITYPDQVWVGDITYVQLALESVYLAILMDVCTRCIRGWQVSRSLDQTLTLTALQRALQSHCPEIHHSDQGLQ
jgi:transposase InsO family protein